MKMWQALAERNFREIPKISIRIEMSLKSVREYPARHLFADHKIKMLVNQQFLVDAVGSIQSQTTEDQRQLPILQHLTQLIRRCHDTVDSRIRTVATELLQ